MANRRPKGAGERACERGYPAQSARAGRGLSGCLWYHFRTFSKVGRGRPGIVVRCRDRNHQLLEPMKTERTSENTAKTWTGDVVPEPIRPETALSGVSPAWLVPGFSRVRTGFVGRSRLHPELHRRCRLGRAESVLTPTLPSVFPKSPYGCSGTGPSYRTTAAVRRAGRFGSPSEPCPRHRVTGVSVATPTALRLPDDFPSPVDPECGVQCVPASSQGLRSRGWDSINVT